ASLALARGSCLHDSGPTQEMARSGLKMSNKKTEIDPDPQVPSLLDALARRFGPLLIVPGALAVLGELDDLREFSSLLSGIIQNWVAFELAFWTALLQPLADFFDVKLQDQFFRGITIPALWSAFAVRLYFFSAGEGATTARQALAKLLPIGLVPIALLLLVYSSSCFYIALNIEGLFEGYLAPDPIYPVGEGFPLILGALLVCGLIYSISTQIVEIEWPTFLFGSYLFIVAAFTLHYWLFIEGVVSDYVIFGIHNFIEAPALYNFPLYAVAFFFIILSVPIFLVGRITGKPVLQLTVAVLFVLVFDYLAKVLEGAHASL
ncbi:MAG: hypothetical protein AAGB04_29655, partial [Pseudomonadota bacterium]